MDDKEKSFITNNDQNNKENITETSSKQSAITNDDGSVTYVSQVTETKKNTGYISNPQKVEEVSLGVSGEDTKYVDAIRAKKELGVLYDDKLFTYISVEAFEKILKFMDESLENYFDALSFGIYSSQEITELKKSIMTIPQKEENITKYFEVFSERDIKNLNKNHDLNDDIFLCVDKELEKIREEEELKKREEEERLKKLKEAEEEKKKWKILRRKRIKNLFEENINSHEPIEIMKRRFKQYREGVEEVKTRQKNKEMEEQRKLLRLKKLKEEEQKRKEDERIIKEFEEKMKKDEEERKRREEEERIKKEEEKKRIIEEERKKREEEERIRKEEEERIKREEEEEKKRKEEEEKKRKEEEEERKRKEEKEGKLKREKEEKRIKEEEEEKRRKEEERMEKEKEEKKFKEVEEIEQKKREEELKKNQEKELKSKHEEDLNLQKKLEEEYLLKKKIEEKKQKILLTLDNKIIEEISPKNENQNNKNIKQKEKENGEIKKIINYQNNEKQKNLMIGNDRKMIEKRKSKNKSQPDIVMMIENKKLSKKPLKKNVLKKFVPTENSKTKRNKDIKSKPLITDYQTLSPMNKSVISRPKKKDNMDNLIFNNTQYNNLLFKYYNDYDANKENNLWTKSELIDARMKRNKSAERRTVKNILEEEEYMKILCNECGEKNYFGNFCENCQGPICSKCKVPHLFENPNHRYNILKNKNYILKKIKREKCTKCEKNLENKNVFKCLNCPNELFCEECKINHNLIYPEHSIIFKTKEKNNDLDSEHSEDSSDNKNISEIIKCLICQKKIKFKDNNYITHCNKCDGNICNNCEKIHSKKKPLHKFISLNTMVINDTSNIENYYTCVNCSKDLNNNLFLYNCPQCNGNLCYICGNVHFKENPKHKISILKSKLPILNNDNYICFICTRDSSNYCNKCKFSLCDKCKENHLQKFTNHKIIKKQKNKLNKNEEENNNEKIQNCVLCRKRIKHSDKNEINYCNNCEGILCKNCIIRHKDYYPYHTIINNNIKNDIKEKNLKLYNEKELQIKYCYQCKRNLSNNNFQYCFRCNENFCDKCGKSHNFKFPKHKLKIDKPKQNNEIDENSSKIIQNDKENFVSNNLQEESDINVGEKYDVHKIAISFNNNPINQEKNDEININNNIKKTNKLGKTNFNNNKAQCNLCGKLKNIYKKCEICKFILCNNCLDAHFEEFPSHKLSYKEKKVDKNFGFENYDSEIKNKKYKCFNCKRHLNLKNDEPIIFCEICKDNICVYCKKTHIVNYPKHNLIEVKKVYIDNTSKRNNISQELKCLMCQKDLENKINEPIITCLRCKGYLCQDCARSHKMKFIRHNLDYKLFIFNEEIKQDISDYETIDKKNECKICQNMIYFTGYENNNYCLACGGIICENCFKIHHKNNDSHKTVPIKKVFRNKNVSSNNLHNINCIICNKDITNEINNPIVFNCSQCNGDLCEECGKEHLINRTLHGISMIKYIFKEKIIGLKCAQCDKYFKNLSIYHNCENCKILLCNKCGDNHRQKYKYHNIITYKNNKNIDVINKLNNSSDREQNENLESDSNKIKEKINIGKCFLCDKDLFSKESDIINHCFDCKCNFCIKCSKNHIKNNFSHDLNVFEVKILKKKEDKYEPNNNCYICNDYINSKIAFYKCENCEIHLCQKCLYNHYKVKHNHNFLLVKYQKDNEETNSINDYIQCDNCNKVLKKEERLICQDCNIFLCEKCNYAFHKKKYPYHTIIANQIFKDGLIEDQKKYLIDSSLISRKDICNTCGIKLNKFSKKICNYCKDIFCYECINKHYKNNYEHRIIKSSSQRNIFINSIFSSKESNDFEKCSKCLKTSNYSPIYQCKQCKINLCKDCSYLHNKMLPFHKLFLSQNISNKNEEKQVQNDNLNCFCKLCKASHFNYQNSFFYFCSECNSNICSLCKTKHDNKYYSHILVFPHKYREEINDNIKRNRRYASVVRSSNK